MRWPWDGLGLIAQHCGHEDRCPDGAYRIDRSRLKELGFKTQSGSLSVAFTLLLGPMRSSPKAAAQKESPCTSEAE